MPPHVSSPGRATVTRLPGDTFHAAVICQFAGASRVQIQTRLYEYMGGILRTQKSRLVAAGGMPDHLHLLVLLDKQLALAELLRELKSRRIKMDS
ncbi:MAG: transposase [Pirellulaceae bacterium]